MPKKKVVGGVQCPICRTAFQTGAEMVIHFNSRCGSGGHIEWHPVQTDHAMGGGSGSGGSSGSKGGEGSGSKNSGGGVVKKRKDPKDQGSGSKKKSKQ